MKKLPLINPIHISTARQFLGAFMPLSTIQMEELLQYCEWRRFNKQQKILNKGETDIYLNIVISGLVRKYIQVKNTEQTLQLATEGHIIQSEISYLNQSPSQVVLQTLEPTILLSMRYSQMQKALEHFSNGERLGRLILTHMYIKKDERRFVRASKTVRELFQNYVQKNPHMLQRIPQKYLASYLNIKPETFSRLKKLQMEKIKSNKN
jgi:CRP-like cAMP-binding protein